MHFGVSLDLDRGIEQVGMFSQHIRHGTLGHRVRHAGIRRKFARHVGMFVKMSMQSLAYEHVSFTAAQFVMEEWGG